MNYMNNYSVGDSFRYRGRHVTVVGYVPAGLLVVDDENNRMVVQG